MEEIAIASYAVIIFALMKKQNIYDHYMEVLNDRLCSLRQVCEDLKESSSNETKSTAGDKHETALAMLQIEQARIGAQLQDIREKKAALEKIDPKLSSSTIVPGSLVTTDKGYLFISIALGKATIQGDVVFALSPQSPLGQKMMGLSVSDVAEINHNRYVIENIE
ncbi:MAG: hypothetical protein ABI472_05845 [Ginsengibacter sp.]